jgi:hypothetical protein
MAAFLSLFKVIRKILKAFNPYTLHPRLVLTLIAGIFANLFVAQNCCGKSVTGDK